MEGGRVKGLEGELGSHSTACRRVRREEDGEKLHLMKKEGPERVCKMAAEPQRWGSWKGLQTAGPASSS